MVPNNNLFVRLLISRFVAGSRCLPQRLWRFSVTAWFRRGGFFQARPGQARPGAEGGKEVEERKAQTC